MKKINLMFAYALVLMSAIISCEKEKEDERDKFVGTWTGTLYFSRIGTEYSSTVIITKSTANSMQILIGQNIATIHGDSYVYEQFTSNVGVPGNYKGTGTIDGNELSESGPITSDDALFEGDLGEWFRHLSKE